MEELYNGEAVYETVAEETVDLITSNEVTETVGGNGKIILGVGGVLLAVLVGTAIAGKKKIENFKTKQYIKYLQKHGYHCSDDPFEGADLPIDELKEDNPKK